MALSVFADKVYEYCTDKGLFVGVSCIVAGLSGGPDSVALISVLSEIAQNKRDFPKVLAVHVNHGLRKSAGDDEYLALSLCDKLGIPCRVFSYDVRQEASKLGRGLEETGRILRYEAFGQCAEEEAGSLGVSRDTVRIATAHHKGDLTETFMMNLFRGAGLEGLTAMTSDSGIIRPLLNVSKDEIFSYLKENGICFAVDETNLESDVTRNKWRNEIIPVIGEVSVKTPEDAVCDTYRLLSRDEEFIAGAANEAYGRCAVREGRYVFLKTDRVCALHPSLGTRAVRLLWEETFGNLTDFEMKHVDIVMGLISSQSGTRSADMPFGRTAVVCNSLLGFTDGGDGTGLACAMATYMGFPAVPSGFGFHVNVNELLNGARTFDLPDSDLVIEASVVENNEAIVYNTYSWICAEDDLDIGVSPAEGIIRKAGSPINADIRKVMSDLKVPRDARQHLIAVSSGGKILWVPGIGHTDGFVSSKSRDKWLGQEGNASKGRLIRLEVLRKEQTGG